MRKLILVFFCISLLSMSCSEEKPLEMGSLAHVNNFRLSSDNRIAVIDAGSGGSTISIVKFHESPSTTDRVETVFSSRKIDPAISTLAGNQQSIKGHLDALMKAVSDGYNESINGVPIFFLATAGMRNIGDVAQKNILDAVKNTVKASSYSFGDAKVISGADEALYAWTAVNFMNSTPKPEDTTGIIEIGGASTQIAFSPKNPDNQPENLAHIKYNKVSYPLYFYSSNEHGFNEAAARFGNKTKCETSNTQSKPASTYKDCVDDFVANMSKQISSCKSNCINWTNAAKQPLIEASQKFVALGGLLSSVADNFISNHQLNKTELESAGNIVCQKTTTEITQALPIKNEKFADKACMQVSYASALLYGDGGTYLGMNMKDASLKTDKKSWTSGFTIFHALHMSIEENQKN